MNDSPGLLAACQRFLDARLRRDTIRFLCLAVLGCSLALLVVMYATSDGGQTAFGPQLGADFAGFYNAGRILNLPGPDSERLYDFPFQDRLYHELLPRLEPEVVNPFVHPPLVATLFRPLALLPYGWALALWLVLSGTLYSGGFLLAWRTMRRLPLADRGPALLLALAFEPFVMECWLGGQFAAVAFFLMAAAWSCEQAGQRFRSGLFLGAVLYKPTLLVLFLPLLLAARQWRILAGVACIGLGMFVLSPLVAGEKVCRDYLGVILDFTGTTLGVGLQRREWKWVDLNSFLRLLLGGPSRMQAVLLVLLSLAPLIVLGRAWWQLDGHGPLYRKAVWAATLTWTLVVNIYVGMYDTVLVVLAVLLTADLVYRPGPHGETELPVPFRTLVLLVFVTAWVGQPLARVMYHLSGGTTALQIYTLVLAALGAYQLGLAGRLAGNTEG